MIDNTIIEELRSVMPEFTKAIRELPSLTTSISAAAESLNDAGKAQSEMADVFKQAADNYRRATEPDHEQSKWTGRLTPDAFRIAGTQPEPDVYRLAADDYKSATPQPPSPSSPTPNQQPALSRESAKWQDVYKAAQDFGKAKPWDMMKSGRGLFKTASRDFRSRRVRQSKRANRVGRVFGKASKGLKRRGRSLAKAAKTFARAKPNRGLSGLGKFASVAKNKAGGLALRAGSMAASGLGSAAGALGSLAATASSLAAVPAAGVTLAVALYGGAKAAEAHSRELLKSQEHFKTLNASIAMTFAQLELADLRRNIQSGQRTQDSIGYLADKSTNLSDQLQPFKDVMANVGNIFGGLVDEAFTSALSPFTPIAEVLNDVLKELARWLKGEKDRNVYMNMQSTIQKLADQELERMGAKIPEPPGPEPKQGIADGIMKTLRAGGFG